MGYILNVQPEDALPGLCFDENTLIELKEGSIIIKDIKVGSILKDGSLVTTKFKLKNVEKIYNLDNIIISGSHMVYFKGKWIYTEEHPDAKLVENYDKTIFILY